MKNQKSIKEVKSSDVKGKQDKNLKDKLKQPKENKTLETSKSVDNIEVEAEIVEVKKESFKNKSIVPIEVYEKIMSFNGIVKSEDLGWLFKTYNTIFGQTLKKCLCSGKVKRMVSKIRVTYERDNQINK